MTIFKAIKKMRPDKGHNNSYRVNIGFLNNRLKFDETQLETEHSIFTQKGVIELTELFASLCKELNTTTNSVIYVKIVACAKNKHLLETMPERSCHS
mgnify:CR=1 FL=1